MEESNHQFPYNSFKPLNGEDIRYYPYTWPASHRPWPPDLSNIPGYKMCYIGCMQGFNPKHLVGNANYCKKYCDQIFIWNIGT